jgi:putative NADPH-quinone reductase
VPKRILLINGHPDTSPHLIHALADAYAAGASEQLHEVRRLDVATLDFPLLRSAQDWQQGKVPPGLVQAQTLIGWAEHVVIFFPLWLGDMPALLKGFLEQVARPGFAFVADQGNPFGRKGLSGKSARVVVTMGMPAAVYRLIYRAHSVRSLERNILGFVGFAPVHETLIGSVDKLGTKGVAKTCQQLHDLGVMAE